RWHCRQKPWRFLLSTSSSGGAPRVHGMGGGMPRATACGRCQLSRRGSSRRLAAASRSSVFEERDRARPPGGRTTHLRGEARDREAGRRQLLEVLQLLDLAVADLGAGLVALPHDGRVAGLLEDAPVDAD